MLLLFLYAFPIYIKQWCPPSHCSLVVLLKREGPVCPQKIFAPCVKSSFSGHVQQEEHVRRVSLPSQDTLSSFWTPLCSKPLVIEGWEWQLDVLLPELTITCTGAQGPDMNNKASSWLLLLWSVTSSDVFVLDTWNTKQSSNPCSYPWSTQILGIAGSCLRHKANTPFHVHLFVFSKPKHSFTNYSFLHKIELV